MEYLCITSNLYGQKRTLEKLKCLSNGLYMTTIRSIEANHIVNQKLTNSSSFFLWHDRLGYPGQSMMRRILNSSHGHPLTNKDLVFSDTLCQTCSLRKLNTRPSYAKTSKDSILFLQMIQGNICGLIQPPCGPFKYFMVLVDASTK